MYSVKKDLSPENILRLISEEDILRHYIGQDFCIGTISSPIRGGDKLPSFSIFRTTGGLKYSLKFRDHATGKTGNCFTLVMLMYSLTFPECLRVINNDFSLGLDTGSSISIRAVHATFSYSDKGAPVKDFRTVIEIHPRPFTPSELRYWKQFNISKSILDRFDVKAVKHYWLLKEDLRRCTRSHPKSPIYAYCFPNDEYKMYAPMKTNGLKWISNTRQLTIQGLVQAIPEVATVPAQAGTIVKQWTQSDPLPAGRLLIITKSLKDVMSLFSFGISAVAPMSESVILQPGQIAKFREWYGNIFSLMDFDRTGVHNANTLRHRYGIEPLFLTNGRLSTKDYGSKDFSDYIRDNGIQKARELLRGLGLKI